MKYSFNFKRTLSLLICIFLLFSCGLKYEPIKLNEHTPETRRAILQSTLKKDFESEGKTYVSLAFGESVTEKPYNYKKLDSLFQLKYYATQNGQNTTVYDNQIEMQQNVIRSDSSEILYIETNFFELRDFNTFEFLIAECKMNGKNELKSFEILDQFYTTKEYEKYAQLYLKDENFSGYAATQKKEDLEFYNLMKNRAAALIGNEREQFLQHVFKLMKIAENDHSVKYSNFLKRLAEIEFTKSNESVNIVDYTFEIELVSEPTKYVEDFYEVTVRKTIEKSPSAIYRFDRYLLPFKN